jgi:hypothetical protein
MMKGTAVNTLIVRSRQTEYKKAYDWIQKKVEKGELKPVKSSGTNGKTPWLYARYLEVDAKKDLQQYKNELQTSILPPLQIGYYMKHLAQYEKDRKYILALNDFLARPETLALLEVQVSLNERSFQIFNDEKFLQENKGRLLKHLGLSQDVLNVYETVEPLIFHTFSRQHKQNILIIENLDTYITALRFLQLYDQPLFLGLDIQTIIYGAGRRIERSFYDLDLFADASLKNKSNQFFYWGDLDWEGLRIYQEFLEKHGSKRNILPFQPGYLAMMEKAKTLKTLPQMKKMQRVDDVSSFMRYFDPHFQSQVLDFLNQDLYIPQEIITLSELERSAEHD